MITESDENFIAQCKLFLSTSENLIDNLLSKVKWTRESIENADIRDTCKYKCDHEVSSSHIKNHESKCLMLKSGWTKDEYDAIPKIPLRSVIGDGFSNGNNSNLCDLEERLQARLDRCKSDVDSASTSRNRRERELELLAEVRDIKRKRQSYRVYKEIKSQTEIHHEIISHQMEMLRDLDKVQRQIDGMSDEEKQDRKKHSKNKKHKDKKSKKSKHSKSKKRKSKHKEHFDE